MDAGDLSATQTYAEGKFCHTFVKRKKTCKAANPRLTLKLFIVDRNHLMPDATVSTKVKKIQAWSQRSCGTNWDVSNWDVPINMYN